ncbi:DUF2336 domain-containing protein [Agrobacterium larrymoorei]|uniref:DUF2336 domain-containing protein n=1 Tax=Agrobacterium larrymoorei TaxID=160699 RepID=A0AAF0H8U0_9HYPH|nr:DUF2336 domain-containing protein [Agrobacterium larrymoorei]WHA39816.1 DUF2336 domain-containing protein [Agrobacterium larrymoorei]
MRRHRRHGAQKISWGAGVIVEAFLRWTDKARSGDRAKAAKALAQAYLEATLPKEKQASAYMAMTYLLDDPSPKVRQALAEALASAHDAPRAILMALAEDQPEIACPVILNSPVLRESDLVDLIGRGSSVTRALIGARPELASGACAALAEIGSECEVAILLENHCAQITPFTLRRVSDRFWEDSSIRNLLLDRDDLPADVRHALVLHVGKALASAAMVCHVITAARAERIVRDASDAAIALIAGEVSGPDIPFLVEHLRKKGELTPAFLIHVLCSGKLDFFAEAISNLSGLEERRVRSILATGRHHAMKALYQSTGLFGTVLEVFLEATLLWRDAAEMPYGGAVHEVSARLIQKFSKVDADANLHELLSMIEKLHIGDQRQRARSFAHDLVAEAA